MSSAWLLPEHLADVLPAQARRVEALRRQWLDGARAYGFELVIPPLLEHLDALLSGAGEHLGLKTFKLVDQLSGRTLGVRADTTSQVARIDAHFLNRQGVARLCYCGPVLHTRPEGLYSSREPLQFGAEIYGHRGLEADLEIQELALELLSHSGLTACTIDLGDARIVRALLAGCSVDDGLIHAALASKDRMALMEASAHLPPPVIDQLLALLELYGDEQVLARAHVQLGGNALVAQTLSDLGWLADRLRRSHPDVRLGFDLTDLSGYAYYSGPRFAVYAPGSGHVMLRGGRYDEVGAVFGRNRPAVGFSADLKQWADHLPAALRVSAIRAPWHDDAQLKTLMATLRAQGEVVVCTLPGHEHEAQAFEFDRELVLEHAQWTVKCL